MRRTCGVACLLCVVATALAVELGGSTKTLASKDPQGSEIAELRAVQETVVQAQHDLDGMNQDEQDAAAMGSEAPAKKASDARADLGEALMKEDDLLQNPAEDTDAAVQAEAMANNVLQEGATEGEEKADHKDVAQVFDLAKTLKQSDLLPEGWTEKTDATTGKNYYENTVTKTTSWDPPRSLVGIALAAAKGQLQLRREVDEMKAKMESQQDLGESANTAVDAQCPKQVEALLGNVHKLQATVKSLAAKLNLTGEQKQLLDNLMKSVVLPAVKPPAKPAAKPPAKPAAKPPAKPAAKPPAKPAAKPGATHAQAETKSMDLGEGDTIEASGSPVELREAEALEQQDDKRERQEVEAAMEAETQEVSKRFAADQKEKEEVIKKASMQAGTAMEQKMAKQDAELLAADHDTEDSMRSIVGSQQQLENEQALFSGTMTPDEVNAVVDPDISKMEKEDLEESNGFAAVYTNHHVAAHNLGSHSRP